MGFLNLFLTLARALLVAIEHFRQRSEGVGNRNLSISDLCEAEAELVLASESKLAGTHETESLSSSLESNSNTSSESVSLVLAVIEGSPSSTLMHLSMSSPTSDVREAVGI